MPPNWLARSFSQRGDGDVGVALPKETIDTFTEFFEAEDLNTIIDSFAKLCQMLGLVPGSCPGSVRGFFVFVMAKPAKFAGT